MNTSINLSAEWNNDIAAVTGWWEKLPAKAKLVVYIAVIALPLTAFLSIVP